MEIDIEHLKRRDRGVWASVYEQLADAVFAHALYRVGGNRPMAEDVTQEVFLRAIESIETFHGNPEGLLSWLRGIARRILAQRARSLRPLAARPLSLDEIAGAGNGIRSWEAADPSSLIYERLVHQEEQLLIGAILTALPFNWKRALDWKYREGLSVLEIARRLGISPKAAESLLGRARAAFKEMYQQLSESDGRLHEVEEWSHE